MYKYKPVSTFLKENMDAVAQTVLKGVFSKSMYNQLTDKNREILNGIVLYHLLRLNEDDRILLMEHFCVDTDKEKTIDCIQQNIDRALSHLQKEALPDMLTVMGNIESEAANTIN